MTKQSMLFCRGMQTLLKLLFLTLLMMAILPWLNSTSVSGGFFLSLYGISHFLPANHQTFGDVYYHFNLMTKVLGIIGSVISLSPLLFGIAVMLKVCKNYAEKNIFTVYNARAFSKLGILYFLSAIILQPISQMFFSFAISLTHPPHLIAFGLDISNLTALIFSLLLIISGQIMKKAYQISEEQKLVI